jgi:hypothetical protein
MGQQECPSLRLCLCRRLPLCLPRLSLSLCLCLPLRLRLRLFLCLRRMRQRAGRRQTAPSSLRRRPVAVVVCWAGWRGC